MVEYITLFVDRGRTSKVCFEERLTDNSSEPVSGIMQVHVMQLKLFMEVKMEKKGRWKNGKCRSSTLQQCTSLVNCEIALLKHTLLTVDFSSHVMLLS